MPEDGFSINVRQSVCRWLIQRAAQCSFQQTAAFWRRETVLHCWAVQSGTCRLTEVSTFYLFLTQWGKDSCISGVSQCPFDLGLLQLLVLSLSTNCQWQGLEIRKPPLCRDGANPGHQMEVSRKVDLSYWWFLISYLPDISKVSVWKLWSHKQRKDYSPLGHLWLHRFS